MALTISLIIIIGIMAVAGFMSQTVKQALVSPIKQAERKDAIPPFLTEKKRYQVIWEDWGLVLIGLSGLLMGCYAGWTVRGWL